MRKIAVWCGVVIAGFWFLLSAIGNLDEAHSLYERRGGILKAIAETSSWWPLMMFAVGLFALSCIQFGSPSKWMRSAEEKKAEQEVYDNTIAAYAEDGFAINAFYLSGGFKLPTRGIRVVLNRLAQIGIEVFPHGTVAAVDQSEFIRRLGETGRSLETPEEANDAWVEWGETGTLRARWEPWPEPTAELQTEPADQLSEDALRAGLDVLIRRGQGLVEGWMTRVDDFARKQRRESESTNWLSEANDFARKHFKPEQIAEFTKQYPKYMDGGKKYNFAEGLREAGVEPGTDDGNLAFEIGYKVKTLEKFRDEPTQLS